MKNLHKHALRHVDHENHISSQKKNQKKSKMLHEINVFLKQNCVLQTVNDSFIRVKVV